MGVTQSKDSAVILDTTQGQLTGIEQKTLDGSPVLHRFLRVPYAQPPVGALRFRRPQPLSPDHSFSTPSGQPGDYTKFGPICPQPEYNTKGALVENPNQAPDVENVQDEDCLYLNIWIPCGNVPASGWPVEFHIHGGWLQVGNANQSNDHDPFDLLRYATRRIIVCPTYRLNIFGFLAGRELAEANDGETGNFGLWDQRAALEWTHKNIKLFGGNPDLITVGGLSAGAHSAFLQLYHDTYLPENQRIIKQGYYISNAIAIQPDSSTSNLLTDQFNSLCEATGVDASTAKEKLAGLRQISSQKLVDAISRLKQHTFRTSTDNNFVPDDFLRTIRNGRFGRNLGEHGVRLVVGEVSGEAALYKLINPPTTYEDLLAQLGNYYPKAVCDKLVSLTDVYDVPERDSDPESEDTRERYKDVFSHMVADMQVHAAERGLIRSLMSAEKPPEIFRYRTEWRAKGLDDYLKPQLGVCHASDTPIWWLSGCRAGYAKEDRDAALEFLRPFGMLLEGKPWSNEERIYGKEGQNKYSRLIRNSGKVEVQVVDELWDRAMKVIDAVDSA